LELRKTFDCFYEYREVKTEKVYRFCKNRERFQLKTTCDHKDRKIQTGTDSVKIEISDHMSPNIQLKAGYMLSARRGDFFCYTIIHYE